MFTLLSSVSGRLKRILPPAGVFIISIWSCVGAGAAPPPEVAEARELIDTYYGRAGNLSRAAELLESAFKVDSTNPDTYVQAARVTIMGGNAGYGGSAGATWKQYEALVDKALALDPENVKALILKGEILDRQAKYEQAIEKLDEAYRQAQARTPGNIDPWIHVLHARVHLHMGQVGHAYASIMSVNAPTEKSTASDRKAYVTALGMKWPIILVGENLVDKLRECARLAVQARYPTDAWTPHEYAEAFITLGLMDDAIVYARATVKTVDSRAAILTLVGALYGKAAQLKMQGAPASKYGLLVTEADKWKFAPSEIIGELVARDSNGEYDMQKLVPTLQGLIPAAKAERAMQKKSSRVGQGA